MPTSLSKDHRKQLEKVTAAARILSESACRAALENLAVHEKEYRSHMDTGQRALRNRLRERGRAIGDVRDRRTNTQEIRHLYELAAYEHWHRLLFTRFLTENHLLITDEANGFVPVTLEECEELASELGARDGLDLACRFASLTLPGVFRRDDPVLDLPVAVNDQVELRKLLASLPRECFLADDALGWTYQFWQSQRKDEVNDSGKKIGADELAPVTQLFTEDYMVEFLLDNTLGAWWAGKLGPIKASSEDEARAHAALGAKGDLPAVSWTYLRLTQDETTKTWRPAAGIFEGWPKAARSIRFLDPCMGSGHFLVFALPLLARLRMEEEKLAAREAVVAAIKDNIYGLELDERCTQIAAFNVALTGWKLAGYQQLPPPHLACSGLAPRATESEWVALAGGDDRLQRGMARLYALFKDAPVLGSLINPRVTGGDLVEAEFHELQPLLEQALAREVKDDTALELAVTARGLAKAAEILAGQFTLLATNVPFLTGIKYSERLRSFILENFEVGKANLATAMAIRLFSLGGKVGTSAYVCPQSWMYLKGYSDYRLSVLENKRPRIVARLGDNSFQSPSANGEPVSLCVFSNAPSASSSILAFDVSAHKTPNSKAIEIRTASPIVLAIDDQIANPMHVISFAKLESHGKVGDVANAFCGVSTSDSPSYIRKFWEIHPLPDRAAKWEFHHSTMSDTALYAGMEHVILWELESGRLAQLAESVKHLNHNAQNWRRGKPNWGRQGVVVSQMGELVTSIYLGNIYDNNCTAIVPTDQTLVPALWAYCSSGNLAKSVRRINQKRSVEVGTFLAASFDLAHWQKVAAAEYPQGLPKPFSKDPTQWLFNGHPKDADQPLHVAVARLLGYQWPRQTGSSFPDCPALKPDGLDKLADDEGIVCLPPLSRKQPAASRLRQLLTSALGTFDERALIAAAGLKGGKSKTLEEWLRDEFFEQHAKLFHDRPFVWHMWDGRPDGFHALVNYHKLDNATLQKLTYSHLGDWVRQQDEDAKADRPGAAARLGAARVLQTKLAAILEGEAPFDIFVRWKPINEQAQGWHPDLNDGVRQNIRPFLLAGDVGKKGAGVFRTVPLDLKDKDRGSEPQRAKKDYPWFWCEKEPGTDPVGGKEFVGTRWNNVHLTLARKRQGKA